LTNYAINKNHEDYESGDEDNTGHKKSLEHILEFIREEHGCDSMWERIKDIIAKTLITVEPSLAHSYRSSRPQDLENSTCFEVLGFDILIDDKLRPWVLEVNHAPSFNTDSDIDREAKRAVIFDTINMLNLSSKRKEQYKKHRTDKL